MGEAPSRVGGQGGGFLGPKGLPLGVPNRTPSPGPGEGPRAEPEGRRKKETQSRERHKGRRHRQSRRQSREREGAREKELSWMRGCQPERTQGTGRWAGREPWTPRAHSGHSARGMCECVSALRDSSGNRGTTATGQAGGQASRVPKAPFVILLLLRSSRIHLPPATGQRGPELPSTPSCSPACAPLAAFSPFTIGHPQTSAVYH